MESVICKSAWRKGVLAYHLQPESRDAELWDLNRRASPLLRLPPEIRNRIYNLLLAHHRIHVVHTLCQRKSRSAQTIPDSEPYPTAKRFNTPKESREPWSQGSFHSLLLQEAINPFKSDLGTPGCVLSRGLTLLSPVCRQLYCETDLIPYATATWSFATPALMERYLLVEKRLPFPQRRAITRLVVNGPRALRKKTRSLLAGLEVVLYWEWMNRRWVEEIIEPRQAKPGEGRAN